MIFGSPKFNGKDTSTPSGAAGLFRRAVEEAGNFYIFRILRLRAKFFSRSAQDASRQSRKSLIFPSIGTSSVVEPAASLPRIAIERGAIVIEINPDETPLTHFATYSLRGASGQILPELVKTAFSS